MNARLHPCVFFDRDGIANVSPTAEERYVLSPERFLVIPAFIEAVRLVTARGYRSVIVTNQKCLSKGLISPEGLDSIHARLHAALAAEGLALWALYVCPHGTDHPDCKPNPGLLLRAARDHALDLARSWMIGDHERDIRAGRAAGCAVTVFVGAGDPPPGTDHGVPSMDALSDLLRLRLPRA